jgi:hypothetical protein
VRSAATTGLALALLLAGSFSWAQTQEPPAVELAGRLGCFACHSLKGPEKKPAASLDGIGARLTPQELETAITYPRRLHPKAKMPSYAYLPPTEQEALVKYLESLK